MSQPVKAAKTEVFFPSNDPSVQYFEAQAKREQIPAANEASSKALETYLTNLMVKRLQEKERERKLKGK